MICKTRITSVSSCSHDGRNWLSKWRYHYTLNFSADGRGLHRCFLVEYVDRVQEEGSEEQFDQFDEF